MHALVRKEEEEEETSSTLTKELDQARLINHPTARAFKSACRRVGASASSADLAAAEARSLSPQLAISLRA